MAGSRAVRQGQVAQLSGYDPACADLGSDYVENLRHVQHTAELLGMAEVAVIVGSLITAIGNPIEASASLVLGEVQDRIVQSGLAAHLQDAAEARLTSMIRNLEPLEAREITTAAGDPCPNPYAAVRRGLIELRRQRFQSQPG